jgi:lipopolysaccharide transport system ATP-binding protein
MSDEVLIKVEGVSKKFCRSLKKSLWYGLKDVAGEVMGRNGNYNQLRPQEFWAVNNVSFELRRGECLGLIGRNGAGKTTLLKMLNGLIKPDRGQIEMRGRVGALIALGAGFNPILTGRENIYVNGSVLGLTKKEIDAKIDEIIDFADIGDFIDTPVQSYSSGMQVRLGFAVATALEPDVLLLDEVLAVGDAAFRNKCYNRIGKMHQRAATIFVSHSMDQISMICNRALVLNRGKCEYNGPVAEGINCYERLTEYLPEEERQEFETIEYPVTWIDFMYQSPNIKYGEYLVLNIKIQCAEAVPDAVLRVVFYNEMHIPFAEWNSRRIRLTLNLVSGLNELSIKIGPLLFKGGVYRLGVNLNNNTGVKMLCWSYKKHSVRIDGFTRIGPDIAFSSTPEISHE